MLDDPPHEPFAGRRLERLLQEFQEPAPADLLGVDEAVVRHVSSLGSGERDTF
jgi:hypothetical protein